MDEAHHLPLRAQRALLRVIENQEYTRLGEIQVRKADVRLVLASNDMGPTNGLVHDLFFRLRRVEIPPLNRRIADIPRMFDRITEGLLARYSLRFDEIRGHLTSAYYAALMHHAFPENNVRGLVDLADKIATRTANGLKPESAIQKSFADSLSPAVPDESRRTAMSHSSDRNETDHASHYEDERDLITEVYLRNKGNVSKTVDALAQRGIMTSRRWLTAYVKLWALPTKKDLR